MRLTLLLFACLACGWVPAAAFAQQRSQATADPYGYGYSRYPRFPFVDPPRRGVGSAREAYVTILVDVPVYESFFDRSSGRWTQRIAGYRQVKKTIRLEWSRKHGSYGYYNDCDQFVPVEGR